MKSRRKLYSFAYSNSPAGGTVGTILIYVDKFELDQIRQSAKRHKIKIESVELKEPYLFSEVVNRFMECGARN